MGSCDGWYYAVIGCAVVLLTASGFLAASRWSAVSARGRVLLLLGLFVVAVGLYRSVLPVQYATRKMWMDTPANAVVTVRSVALLAELSIAALLYLSYAQRGGADGWGAAVFAACVVAAQVPATVGCYTSLNWLFALEETLWMAAGVALMVPTVAVLLPTRFGAVMAVALGVYIAFQAVAVPMQWAGELGVVSTLPWTQVESRVRRDCSDYGALFFTWSTGYFVLLSLLVLFLQRSAQ